MSAEDKKQMQRVVQKHEKRIADLEKEIATFEAKMTDPEFYNRPESQATLKKYADLKAELAKVYEEWELAVERMG
ncbi:MAG: hypothetical protein KA165_06500 [Saprospiraceae bacterium]|nr:hypothetical protein [Saprospiraceae bacterium]